MGFKWLNEYDKGVRQVINVAPFDSLVLSFNDFCQKYNDLVAFSNFGVKLTYRELFVQVQFLAAFLQVELGVKKGDRVAIMMPNLLQYPIAIYAALSVGAMVVNINPLYTARELKHALVDSGAETILICENFAQTLGKVHSETKIKNVILTGIGDRLGLKGCLINFVLRYIKKQIPRFSIPGAWRFNTCIKKGKSLRLREVDLTLDDIAFLQYTGGTTGPSKGAELTHGNMLANANQFREWIKSIVVSGEDIAVTPLPLYHIFSLTVCCIAYIGLGAECMLITNPRDIGGFIKLLSKRMGSFFVGINTLYNALASHSKFKKIDCRKLKFCGSGGMATQSAVDKKWYDLTGLHIIEGYGLTETSPVVTFSPVSVREFSGSIGVPLPNTELSVRDENGKALEEEEEGEIWIRGPQVMKGYWNKPEETANALTQDGWFKSGDIGKMDARGRFFIVDRKKDMILVSGFNVYPNEIEKILVEHEGILEAAVIGIASERSGEAVKAYIVKSDPGLIERDIISYCRLNMTRYKVPRQVEFVDDLPKSNVGKVLRRVLRDDENLQC